MRIALITAAFPPYQAGTGIVCYYNARDLARRGHHVQVFTSACPDAPAQERIDGFSVQRLRPLFRLGNAPFTPGLLWLQDFDLIHLHYPFIFGAELVWLLSRRKKIPYIITYHNDLIGAGFKGWLFKCYHFLTAKFVLRGAARCAVVSRDHAAHSQLPDVLADRWDEVIEIPNGVDGELFNTGVNPKHVFDELAPPKESRWVLFVSPLDPAHCYRRLDLLIQAIEKLDDLKIHLMVVGGGSWQKKYQRLAAQSGLGEQVHFLGSIPHPHLPPYYRAADVLVLPSQNQESFGLVLIEALACGTPVIASDLPGARTIVTDGVDGLLIQLADSDALARALAQILGLPKQRRQQMGLDGRDKVLACYNWALAAECLENLYDQVVS